MFFYMIFVTTFVLSILTQAEHSSINFYRQTPKDAKQPWSYLWNKFDPAVKYHYPGQLEEYIEDNPAYLLFRSQEDLENITIPFYIPGLIKENWERFESVKIGDPRFPFLWRHINKIELILTKETGYGYLRPRYRKGAYREVMTDAF